MNRTDEITSALRDAQGAGATGNTWADTYRDHVAYLLNVVRSYGPSLQEKLREQSRRLAELERMVRRQRVALIGVTTVAVVAVLAAATSLSSSGAGAPRAIAVAQASEQGPPIDRILGTIERDPMSADGWYCTAWEPVGTSCPGGCWWVRYCTPCIPGCEWFKDWECRPSSSGCPSLLVESTLHGMIDPVWRQKVAGP